jgi:protocatechuate 3,4-dioxygenase beta subunit
LEDPFRHTLILHYFEGLSVTEIASKLGAPKPTISSRLKRGRERLREMMQTRYGSSAYGMCAAAAGPFAPATLAAGSANAAATKSWMPAAGIAAAAVLIGVATIVNLRPETESIENAYGQPSLAEHSAAGASQPNNTLATQRLASNQDTEDGRNGVGVEGDSLVRIKGRCVDDVTGMAIQGALVKVYASASSDDKVALYGVANWQAPRDTTTDGNGEFVVEFEENLSQQLSISIEPHAYSPRTARWSLLYDGLAAGTTTELGEIRFQVGFQVLGTVVDQDGEPVEGLTVSLADLPLPLPMRGAPNNSRSGTSDALGNFTISAPVAPGRYPVRMSNRTGYGSYEDLFLSVGQQGLESPWLLEVEKLKTIRGQVVDQYGSPIHHVYMKADPEVHTSSKSLSSWTKEDGSFCIYRRHPAGPVRLNTRAGVTDAWSDNGLTDWGSAGIVVQLHRRPNLQVQVSEAISGDPIEEFAVQVKEGGAGGGGFSGTRLGGTHPDGLLTIDSVPETNFHVAVVPRVRGQVVSPWTFVESTASADQPIPIELESLQSYEVLLVDHAGDPVAGSTIEILDLEGTVLNEEDRTRRTRLHPENPHINIFTGALYLDEVQTDEQGYAQVFGYSDRPMAVRVTGDHSILLIPDWAPLSQGLNKLELEASGRLHISLLEGCTWERPGIHLRSVGDSIRRMGISEFPASGELEVSSLKPGTYELLWAVYSRFDDADGSGSFGGSSIFVPPLATIQIDANETVQFEIEPAPLEPAQLRGTVRLNGEAATGGSLIIRADLKRRGTEARTEQTSSFGAYQVDSNGLFNATQFASGEVRIFYVPRVSDNENQFSVEHSVAVHTDPGQLRVQDLDFSIAGIELQLVDALGSPVSGKSLRVVNSKNESISIVTDANGEYRIDAVPADGIGVFTLEQLEIGTIKPEAGQRWTEVELTLPE